MKIPMRTIGGLDAMTATSAVPRIPLHLCCWLCVTTMNSCQLFGVCGMQGSVNPILHVHLIRFWGAKGASILFSDLGFCVFIFSAQR